MTEKIFLLPDVGEGLVEADIVEWKVSVGDVVSLNQPLVDIETAKAVVELPSPYQGTVLTLHGKVGDTMEVEKPLITFEIGGSDPAPAAASNEDAAVDPSATAGEKREPVLVGYGVATDEGPSTRARRRRQVGGEPREEVSVAKAPAATPAMAPRSTPPVRLFAKQNGLAIETIPGTGRDGLITRGDVERALSGAAQPAARIRSSAPLPGPTSPSRFVGRDIDSWSTGAQEERIPVKGVLKSMADAMVKSASSAPHAAVWVRLDATKTVELLASLKTRDSMSHVRLSPLTIAALAVCDAARHFPGINSSFDGDAGEVIVRRTVNLGIAADTPRGLVVPNIKGADQLDLVGMAEALNELVEKARNGTTSPAEMSGTTISITNVGPFGVDAAVPILPPGTGAILVMGQIAKAPWVVDDEVVVRHVIEIAMSFDHRQIDGALASRVIGHVARFLEDPAAAIIAG